MISYTEALKKLNYAPAKQGLRAARRGEETDAGTGAKSAPAASYSDALRGRLYDAPAKTADAGMGSTRSHNGGGGSLGGPLINEFRSMNVPNVETDIGMTGDEKKAEKNRLLENMNSLIGSINTLKTAQSRGANVSDRLGELTAQLDAAQKEYDRIVRSGLHSRADELQWQIDDARKTVNGINGLMPRTDAEWRSAASDIKSGKNGLSALGGELMRAQNGLREAKDDRKLLDYVNKYDEKTLKTRKDTFGGQFGANYTLGRLTQDGNLAWDRYLSEPNERNRVRARVISELTEQMQANNVTALDGENTKLPWLSKDLANYLPQFIDQLEYEAAGAAAGGLAGSAIPGVGTAAGMKAGAIAGSGLYSFRSVRGAAFRGLTELGVPEEQARKAASDEAVISSMIEMADTGLDLVTLGTGKVLSAFGKQGVKQIAGKAISEWAGNTAFRKLLVGLGKYGINILGETAEEALQEAVSIANEKRAGTGRLDLVRSSADVLNNAALGRDPEAKARITEAGKGGARLAAMLGGGTMLTTGLGENVMNGGRNITAENGQIEGENGQNMRRGIGEGLSLPAPGMTEEEKTRLNAERKNTPEPPRYLPAPGITEEEAARLRGKQTPAQGPEQTRPTPKGDSETGTIRKRFAADFDNWMNTTTQEQRAKDGGRFLIGHTSNQLKQANVDDYDIYFGKSKIARILLNLEMTPQIIKEVADVIEAPVIVMDSKTVPGSITMFGNSKTANGKPVMVSMLLHPTTKTGEILDYGVVTSAYGRRTNNAQNLIDTSNIRYIDPDSKRTGEWMKALGLHLPSASSTAGSEEIDRSSTSHAPDGAQEDISRPTIASSDTIPQQNQTVNTSEGAAGGQNTEAGADAAGEAPASAREGGQNTAILYSFHNIPVPTYEQLIEKPDIPVVDIRKTRHGSFKQEREEFLNSERAHRLYSAPVTNRDTGEIIFITPATVRHSFSNIGWEQIELAEHLPEIIESAVLIHAEQSRKAPEDRTTGVYILLGAAMTDNGVQPVKLTVKEYSIKGQRLPKDIESYYGTGSDPTTYADIYDGKVLILESIKKEEPSGSATTDTAKNAAVSYPLGSLDESPSGSAGSAAAIVPTAQFHPSGPSKISVNDLLSLVKGTAAKYIPTSFRYDPPLYLPAPGMTKEEKMRMRAQTAHSSALKAGADTDAAESAARLAGMLNKDIRFYNDPARNGSLTNGYTENGTIYINAASKYRPVVWIVAHELTHSVENSGAYNGLLRIAKAHYGDGWTDVLQSRIRSAEQAAQNLGNEKLRLTAEAAERELAADFFADKLLTDEDAIRRAVNYDPTTAQRIAAYLKNLLNRLQGREPTLEWALDRYNTALREAARREANYENASGRQYSIITLPDGKQFVRADRQVIFGNDSTKWREQAENYINGKIRNGEDIRIIAEDGDVLMLTKDTSGKITSPYKNGRSLDNEIYFRKLTAGTHIDELSKISMRGNKSKPDTGSRHGDFASDGWNYRTAYFQDYDGMYYKLKISVAQNANGNVIYNIGDMKEETPPQRKERKPGS